MEKKTKPIMEQITSTHIKYINGKSLAYLRNKNHLTQQNLAEKCNISKQYISKIENCTKYAESRKIRVSNKVFYKIRDCFDCSEDYLSGEAFSDELTYKNDKCKGMAIHCPKYLDTANRAFRLSGRNEDLLNKIMDFIELVDEDTKDALYQLMNSLIKCYNKKREKI